MFGPAELPPHEDAAGETGIEGVETVLERKRVDAPGLDVRSAARPGRGDNVRAPVAVDVGRGPPGPAQVNISAVPSWLTSPAATVTPPVNVGEYAKKLRISAPVAPLNALTCGPPPAPAPTMMSARPSASISPAATLTPPVKLAPNAKKL